MPHIAIVAALVCVAAAVLCIFNALAEGWRNRRRGQP